MEPTRKHFGGTDFVAGFNKTYGGIGEDGVSMTGLIQTKDGGYALGGLTGGLGGITYGKPWLVKTDARGNVQWNRTYGGAGGDFFFTLPLHL